MKKNDAIYERLRDDFIAGIGGDHARYGAFLKAVLPIVRGMVGKKIGSESQEDVVQEVLISLHKARHTYDGKRTIMPWVAAIVQFRVTDYLRKYYSEHRGEMVEIEENTLEDVTQSDDSGESVNDLLHCVAEREQRILTLMHVEGYTAKEIAKQLDMSPSAVKVAAHRAIKQLRQEHSNEHG